MVDINLRKRALTKAGYRAVYDASAKGWHLQLPDGDYLLEPYSCLPDWFASEDLAWRAAPAVETSLDIALSELGGVRFQINVDRHGYYAHINLDELGTDTLGYGRNIPAIARVVCEAYGMMELKTA